MPARIVATADYRPNELITDEALAAALGGRDVPMACRFSGVTGRHWSADPHTGDVDPDHLTSGLSASAGRRALAAASVDPGRIGAVISATCTPETALPQTSALVQTGVGIPDCQCIDLRSGCAGIVTGLDLAASLVQQGRAEHVLVTGADCFSPLNLPRLQDRSSRSVEDVMDAVMLSDMAVAAVVSRCEPGEPGEILSFAAGSPRPQVPPGLVTEPMVPIEMLPFEWAPSRKMGRPPRVSQRHRLIAEHLPSVIEEAVGVAERMADTRWLDFSAVIGPQANPVLMRDVLRSVSLAICGEIVEDERHPFVIGDRIGNCPGAAVLQGYHLLLQEMPPEPGSRVLLLGAESPRWLYSVMVVRV